jgi:hypothetical protein
MQTMHWYNPVTKEKEDVPVPLNDEQAIEMLSGHPNTRTTTGLSRSTGGCAQHIRTP